MRAPVPGWCVHVPVRLQEVPSRLEYAVKCSSSPMVRLAMRSHRVSSAGPPTVSP